MILVLLGYSRCTSLSLWVPLFLKDACNWIDPLRGVGKFIGCQPDSHPYLCNDPDDPTRIMPMYRLDWWSSPGVDVETFCFRDAEFQDAFALYCCQVLKHLRFVAFYTLTGCTGRNQ